VIDGPYRRYEVADRRLLDMAREVDGGGDRVGQAVPHDADNDRRVEPDPADTGQGADTVTLLFCPVPNGAAGVNRFKGRCRSNLLGYVP
jgi:hypothetical protein